MHTLRDVKNGIHALDYRYMSLRTMLDLAQQFVELRFY